MAATEAANLEAVDVMARVRALLDRHTEAPPPMDASIPVNPRAAAASDEKSIAAAISRVLCIDTSQLDAFAIGETPGSFYSRLGVGFRLGAHLGVALRLRAAPGEPLNELHIFFAVRGARVHVSLPAEEPPPPPTSAEDAGSGVKHG